jgi:ribosomal-protein-alanine N-acetyltransferase
MPLPVIETPRLRLRNWRDEDLQPWFEMGADPRVMEFFPSVYDRERSDSIAASVRQRNEVNPYGWWVIEEKDGEPFAGVMQLADVPFEAHFTPVHEIGWRLPAKFWGRGYATEAARAILDYAFERLGMDEVVALTTVMNVRSRRVMERLGMTRDPNDDFDNPRVPEGHALQRHVLYRIRKAAR